MFGELQKIEFVGVDKALLVGEGIPFRYGKVHALTYVGGEISVTIRPDLFAEQQMNAIPRVGFLRRLLARLRG